MIRFLAVDDVNRLHELTIRTQGGSPGLRDSGLLDAAVSMPMQTFGGEYLHKGIAAMAAAYLFHICQAHAYVDGNKRTAVLASLVFLSANGAGPLPPAEALEQVTLVAEALDESPTPEHEWHTLQVVLTLPLLARLLNISESSARRYLGAVRATPDPVAARLHFLAMVVSDLAGAYNDIGVRRWFDRPRQQFRGRAPAALLAGDWLPEQGGPRRVRELAGALGFTVAT